MEVYTSIASIISFRLEFVSKFRKTRDIDLGGGGGGGGGEKIRHHLQQGSYLIQLGIDVPKFNTHPICRGHT